jgi:hypothetical protein
LKSTIAWLSFRQLGCQKEALFHRSYCTAHYKHIHVFLKVNKLFKRLIITEDAQNVSLLFLNMLQVFQKLFVTSFVSLTTIDVIVSWMLCLNLSNVWGLFKNILSCLKKGLKSVGDISVWVNIAVKNTLCSIRVAVMIHHTPIFLSWWGTSEISLGLILL